MALIVKSSLSPVLSQVVFKKLTVSLTHLSADFTFEGLDDEDVSVRVDESGVSAAPRLVFWFSDKLDSFVLEVSIALVNIVNKQTNIGLCFELYTERHSGYVKNCTCRPFGQFLKTKNILVESRGLFQVRNADSNIWYPLDMTTFLRRILHPPSLFRCHQIYWFALITQIIVQHTKGTQISQLAPFTEKFESSCVVNYMDYFAGLESDSSTTLH